MEINELITALAEGYGSHTKVAEALGMSARSWQRLRQTGDFHPRHKRLMEWAYNNMPRKGRKK